MNGKSWLQKNLVNILLAGFILLVLLYTPAKVWVLQRIMDTGLLNASVDKTNVEAMPMTFSNPDGELISTKTLKGKIVFINFWATWCPPCLAELPSIQNLYNRYKDDKRIVFIMADVDNKVAESISFLNKRSIELPVYAPSGVMDPALYQGTLPTTLILDKEGKVLLKHSGIGRYDTPAIIELLNGELTR